VVQIRSVKHDAGGRRRIGRATVVARHAVAVDRGTRYCRVTGCLHGLDRRSTSAMQG
jgi:hypothetical protein